ncbi:hypothetical protein D5R81_03865 [Parashewanella spongiae]|uniref:LRAT domain-containing protein n=1 Tax=Parashewanella spongiae TaxID=342950 RepID=A0A3A6U3Q9_9GAMM|nr:lecithin retinol acyltransferase family protein [Parashewanella spongiae]MCL1077051.1 lecithin retinol acyltransferase family protein [Parashewanella spongiae]RJY18735.1 hypothetical protein D5R81_03865 [Parashewanella spongiae]
MSPCSPSYRLGDHLITRFDAYGILHHHGLYVGNDAVIHLSPDANGVELTGLSGFANHHPIHVKRHAPNPEQAVNRAYALLDDGSYHLLHFNCEHFVNYCIDGIGYSEQVGQAYFTAELTASASGLLGKEMQRHVTNTPLSTLQLAGNRIAAPLERAVSGVSTTLSDTTAALCQGQVLQAAEQLISGLWITSTESVELIVHQAVNDISAIKESIEDMWDWLWR